MVEASASERKRRVNGKYQALKFCLDDESPPKVKVEDHLDIQVDDVGNNRPKSQQVK